MRVGTKSVLFGAHSPLVHPCFVALAWWKLYGFPFDPRLWISFFIHDLGYFGKANIDGKEGEKHVEFGAGIMKRFFGDYWGDFCKYHSRYYAKKDHKPFSRLCVADKLGVGITPSWIFLPLAWFSGELEEYKRLSLEPKYTHLNNPYTKGRPWFLKLKQKLCEWAIVHKNGKTDLDTPSY